MCSHQRESSDSAVFFFNDTATTEIYTLSLHDALPIYHLRRPQARRQLRRGAVQLLPDRADSEACRAAHRSEEHTSELQSRLHLVCRPLLGKKTIIPSSDQIASYSRPSSSRILALSARP